MQALLLVIALLLFASAALAGGARAGADADAPPPSLSSDKADYAPGELVTLNGSNWAPGEAVHIAVNDDAGQTWRRDVDVTADGNGNVVDEFNLPNWFVAVYSVTATGVVSGTATTSFTDANLTFQLASTSADNAAPANLQWSVAWEKFNGSAVCGGSGNSNGTVAYSGNTKTSGTEPGVNGNQSVAVAVSATAFTLKYWSTTSTSTVVVGTTLADGRICLTGESGPFERFAHFKVSNRPPTANAGGPYSVTEGGSVGLSGSGSDPDGDSLTYAWDLDNNGTFETAGQSPSFSASAIDGPVSRTVVLRVTDGKGGSATSSATVNITNVAPAATLNAPASVAEGASINISLSAPSDPSSADSAAGFTYAFDCGSGYGPFGAANDTSCPASDNGSRTVSGQIRDKDGGTSEYTASVSVTNVPPTVMLSGPVSADEGDSVSYGYTWSDPGSGDSFPAAGNSVDCGAKGTASDRVFAPAAKTGSLTCTFSDDSGAGSFAVEVMVGDDDGGIGSDTKHVEVANVAPTATFADDGPVDEGSSFHLSLTGGDDVSSADKAAGFQYRFDCGDGSGYGAWSTAAADACPTNDDGVRQIKGQIRDKDSGVREYTGTVTVRNVAPTVALSGDVEVDEGTTHTYSFAVSDPGEDGFSVNDGSPSCGAGGELVASSLETDDDGGGSFRCSFPDGPADSTVAIMVSDDDGAGSTEAIQSVHVGNVAPSVSLAAGNDLMLDEGSTHTYTYSVVDPGNDSVTSVHTGCGATGVKVGSESNTSIGGDFRCRFPDGPADSDVSASATDSDGDTGAADTQSVHVANVAPSVSLSGDAEVDEGTAHTYSFTVSDPGADTFSVNDGYPTCGAGGELVASSLETDDDGGSFRCSFPDGPATITVAIKVADSDGASVADSEAVQVVEVANVAPAVTAAPDQSADEGESKTFDLGGFTDPGSDTPWSVDVDWGDGSTHTAFSETTAGALAGKSHTFGDNGAYTIALTVTDKDGAYDSKTFQVEVVNVAPTAIFGDDGPVDEGSSFTVSLTDPHDVAADEAAGFTYAFDCGDGSGYGAWGATASASCATSDDGVRLVGGEIRDKDGGVREYTGEVTVRNVAPSVSAPADQSADEGESKPFDLGGFTDPGADSPWQVGVDWGDGLPQSTFQATVAAGLPSTSHAYADNGSYTVTVTVTDKNGANDSETFQVSVANVAPAISAPADHTADEGVSRDFELGSFADPGADAPWHVDVDWGDGSVHHAATVMSAGSLGLAPHAYGDNGVYTVTVTVADKDGASDATAFKVTVENVAPTAAFGSDGPVDEGSSFTLSLTDWHDVAADEAAGFTYAFDCGDGSGYGAYDASAGATCPTSDSGTRNVKGQIRDKDGGARAYDGSVIVRNVAPTLTTAPNQTGSEGSSAAFDLGFFSDPGADSPWSVEVNWGDGSAHTTFGATSRGAIGSKNHTYGDNGTHTVTVKVTDKDGGSDAKSFTVAISNVAPRITSFAGTDYLYGPNSFVNNVTPMSTFTTLFTDPGADTWSAFFNWADGTPLSQTVSPFQSGQALTHAFNSAGCKTASVRVTDDDGDFDAASTVVKVGTGQFLPPMTNQPVTDKLKNGQVLPVKIKIADCNGLPVTNLAPAIRLLKGDLTPLLDDATAPISVPTSSSAADTTGVMRSNGDGSYIYNMQVNITLNTDYTVLVYPYGIANPQKLGHVVQATK